MLLLFLFTSMCRFREEARSSEARLIALASALKTKAAASAALAAAEDHQLHGGQDRVHIIKAKKVRSSGAKQTLVCGYGAKSQESIDLLRMTIASNDSSNLKELASTLFI